MADTIRVRFDKHGFYHPTFGRLGRGENKGRVYVLPKEFAEKETITVDVLDRRTKPAQKIDERTITRFKYLPSTAEIIDDKSWTEAAEKARYENEEPEKEFTPTISAEAEVYLEKMGIKDTRKVPGKRGTARRKS